MKMPVKVLSLLDVESLGQLPATLKSRRRRRQRRAITLVLDCENPLKITFLV